jgi:hypothetical protein
MSLSDNLRRLPRERVPTVAVGGDLHGFLMLTRMGSRRTEKQPTGRGPEGCVETAHFERNDITIICETVH